jgi:hypothetical protein
MNAELSGINSDEHARCIVARLAGTLKVARIPEYVICDSHVPAYKGWITPQCSYAEYIAIDG